MTSNGASPATGAPAFDTTCPPTFTAPARIRERARALEAEQRRIRRLRARRVLSRRFAELAGLAFDVEDIVDDLKCQSEIGGVAIDGAEGFVKCAGHDRTAHSRCANQRTCLASV